MWFYGQCACLANDRLWECVSNEKLTRKHMFFLIAALPLSSPFSIFALSLSHIFSLKKIVICASSLRRRCCPFFAFSAFISAKHLVISCFFVNIGAPQAVVGLTYVTCTEKVLSYDVKERSWRSILADENLRPSHLWKFSVINKPVDIMAGEIAAPAADDAMRRLREKRKGKKKAQSSDQAASTPPPPPSSRAKASLDVSSTGKKRRREDSTSGVDASVDLVFPQDVSAYSDVGSILPQVERLLLPEDKSRLREMGLSQAADWGLGHLFQALQSHVHLKEELGLALKKVRDLKVSNQSLKADNDKLKALNVEAKKTALEASSCAVEATLELNKLKSSVDLLEAKLKAKEADYDSLYEKAEDNILNAVIKTRADLMREYRDGRATEWKVDSWIADHEELSRSDEDEANDKPVGEEPILPPPKGSTVVSLAAQPTGEHDDLAP
ncbi:hypothetical protein ACOSQ2_013151 [Xanthoceras sorbifolium]